MMKLKRQVRLVNSKQASVCAETSLPIESGQECLFDPATRKVFHPQSHRMRDFKSAQKRTPQKPTKIHAAT